MIPTIFSKEAQPFGPVQTSAGFAFVEKQKHNIFLTITIPLSKAKRVIFEPDLVWRWKSTLFKSNSVAYDFLPRINSVFIFHGHAIRLTISLDIALYTYDGDDIDMRVKTLMSPYIGPNN